MKFKKIMIVGLLLLAILAIGAVSASDDVNNLTASDSDDSVESTVDVVADDVYQQTSDDELGDNPEITISDEYNRDYDDTVIVEYNFPDDYSGRISITLDEEEYYDSYITSGEPVSIYGSDLWYNPSCGIYDVAVKYYDDEKYEDFTQDGTLTVTEDIREPDCEINVDDIYDVGNSEYDIVSIYIYDSDVSGNLTIFVDNKNKYETELINDKEIYLSAETLGVDKLDYGDYTIKVKYSGDENYLGFEREYNLTVTYRFRAEFDDTGNVLYNQNYFINVILDSSAKGNVVYTVNGKQYTVSAQDLSSDDNYIRLNKEDLKYGANEIIFKYVEDDFPEKTLDLSTNILSAPEFGSNTIAFDGSTYVAIVLPSDAKGTLKVYEVGDDDEYILFKKMDVKNGIANITLDKLQLGHYAFHIEYDGDDYEILNDYEFSEFYVHVIPKIDMPSMIYSGDESTAAEFTLPSSYNGKLTVTIGEETKTFDVKDGAASFEIFNLESATIDEEFGDEYPTIYISINYDNEIDYSFEDDYYVKIIDTPKDYGFEIKGDTEIVKYGGYDPQLKFGEMASGLVEIYVDGKNVTVEEVHSTEMYIYIDTDNLTYGEHTVEFKYSGDDYYTPATKTVKISIVPVVIQIDDVIIGKYQGYESSNNAVVYVVEDATGTVTLKVDNKIIETINVNKEDVSFNLENLTAGEHVVEITYEGNYPGVSKKETITAKYDSFYFSEYSYIYGDVNTISGAYPVGATGKVTVTIGENTYNANIDENGSVVIDISDLKAGEYTAFFTYPGDAKYPALSGNTSFKVSYEIIGEYYNVYFLDLDDAVYSLTLPEDAKGELQVCVYGGYDDDLGDDVYDVIGKVQLLNGKAEISIADLSIDEEKLIGEHSFYIRYSGDDYEVSSLDDDVVIQQYKLIEPESTIFNLGEEIEYTFELPSTSSGVINVYLEGSDDVPVENLTLVNGKATFSLTNKFMGIKYYKFVYDDDFSFEEYVRAEVWPENITVNHNCSDDESVMTVKLPNDAKGTFTIFLWNHKHNDSYHGENVSVSYTGNTASIPASKIANGEYSIENFIIDDEKYGTFRFIGTSHWFGIGVYTEITVSNSAEDTKITPVGAEMTVATSDITEGETATITITINKNATGNIVVKVAGKDYTAAISNGKATANVKDLVSGNYTVEATYAGNDYVLSDTKTALLKVIKKETPAENTTGGDKTNSTPAPADNSTDVPVTPTPSNATDVEVDPKITASDLKMYYYDGSKYQVRVYGTDGKPASGVSVVFKLDGKKFKTLTTDKDGYAKVKITKTPKTYKISATALGITVTKKLTVKKVLTLKKVKVKKSAKKLVLTATLKKVKGKYLKGKKITFKFNGKKFKAKTNKKGVAKITIKKSVLGKLKVGKKVKYQATYIKSTVKYSIKVKK